MTDAELLQTVANNAAYIVMLEIERDRLVAQRAILIDALEKYRGIKAVRPPIGFADDVLAQLAKMMEEPNPMRNP